VELIKSAGDEVVTAITRLCRRILETNQWPEYWRCSVFIPIPKKGDARECENNRTIAIISHTSKIILKIIQRRLENVVERDLEDVQAGFRKCKRTRHQKSFINYSKAFDCVDHEVLWVSLRKMGIPDHLIPLLRSLYTRQQASVCTAVGETEGFDIGKGVRQGWILSLYLFNLYTERIMRQTGLSEDDMGVKIGGRTISNLRYADDATLLAGDEEELRSMLRKVMEVSSRAGLYLNVKKTKVFLTFRYNHLMNYRQKLCYNL